MNDKTTAIMKIVWGIILLICSILLFSYVKNIFVKGIVSCWCFILTIGIIFSTYALITSNKTGKLST